MNNSNSVPIALFRLGQIVATPNALARLTYQEILAALRRHQAGDWGAVCEDDREANNRALENGTRLFSVYHSGQQLKFWIITEAGREVTTVLMPEDY